MSAGPSVHINLCCGIASKSGRETLSNGRACSILALGGCVAQTWNLTFASGITGSSGSVGLRPAAFIIRTEAGNTLQRYWEALENYAYVDNGLNMVGELGRMAKEASDGEAWPNSIDSTRATKRLDNTDPK